MTNPPELDTFPDFPSRIATGGTWETTIAGWWAAFRAALESLNTYLAWLWQQGFTRLIASSTTLYVATTGSDDTGTGDIDTPYASIARALSSLADKRIAPGAKVTIQVAHGIYGISSMMTIAHPDADKIQIIGDISVETTVPIAAIDASAKTIAVAGDYTGSILSGDIVVITGSSTSGLSGAYKISGVAYSGAKTILTCSAETFASSTVGGGSLIIKPCNRVMLNCDDGLTAFTISRSISLVAGFIITGKNTGRAIYCDHSKMTLAKIIISNFGTGIEFDTASVLNFGDVAIKSCTTYGLLCWYMSVVKLFSKVVFDSCACGVDAVACGCCFLSSVWTTYRNNAVDCSPAAGTIGNSGACVYNS